MQDRSHSLGASALFFSLIQGFVKYSSLEWVRWAVGVGMAHRVEQGHEADLGGGDNQGGNWPSLFTQQSCPPPSSTAGTKPNPPSWLWEETV